MKKHNRSILTELQNAIPENHRESVIENRGNHIIQSAINLLEQIYKIYPVDQAQDLEKRFYSAIRNQDTARFDRAVRKIKNQSGDQTSD